MEFTTLETGGGLDPHLLVVVVPGEVCRKASASGSSLKKGTTTDSWTGISRKNGNLRVALPDETMMSAALSLALARVATRLAGRDDRVSPEPAMIRTFDQACQFVHEHKVCTIFGSKNSPYPSLWDNVDLPDRKKGEKGWGEKITAVWTWKN